MMQASVAPQQNNRFESCQKTASDVRYRVAAESGLACAASKGVRPVFSCPRCGPRLSLVIFFLGFVTLMLPGRPGLPPEIWAAPVTPTIEVAFQKGLLTVNVQEATLAEILRAIAATVNFDTKIYSGLSPRTITRAFVAQPLPGVLRDLLRDQSWALLYAEPQGQHIQQLQAKLWVFGKSTELSSAEAFSTRDFQVYHPDKISQTGSATSVHAARPSSNRVGNKSETALHAQVLAQDKDPSRRTKAILELEYIGGAEAVRALQASLGDLNSSVRLHVIRSLEHLEGERALPNFGQIMYSDPDPKVRLAAVQAIARQRSPVVPGFLKAAARDKDDTVRATAIRALTSWR